MEHGQPLTSTTTDAPTATAAATANARPFSASGATFGILSVCVHPHHRRHNRRHNYRRPLACVAALVCTAAVALSALAAFLLPASAWRLPPPGSQPHHKPAAAASDLSSPAGAAAAAHESVMPDNDNATPPVIILIRHAEKHAWTAGASPSRATVAAFVDDHELSSKGWERAHALAAYFGARRELRDLLAAAPLAAVFAQQAVVGSAREGGGGGGGGGGRSDRPRQTVLPLLAALAAGSTTTTPAAYASAEGGVRSDTSVPAPVPPLHLYPRSAAASLAARLTGAAGQREFGGRSVLVCWSHQGLPALAAALGAPRTQVPPKWGGGRYDVTWVLHPVPVPTAANGGGREWEYRLVQLPQRLLYGDRDSVFDVGNGFHGPALAVGTADEEVGEDDGDD
ncbi:hypothetical protein HK405_015790 [Cladochytrium tenue]|nr:hypothetical protein HK405_015790 [Cladochytrium tenue]